MLKGVSFAFMRRLHANQPAPMVKKNRHEAQEIRAAAPTRNRQIYGTDPNGSRLLENRATIMDIRNAARRRKK